MSSMLTLAGNAAPTGFYDFPIEQSLRFNDNDSAYLSRTPASAGTQTTYTLSMWFKYGNIKDMMLFGAGSSTSNQTYIRLWGGANQSILWETDTSATTDWYVRTNALLRDPSAWYHLTFVFDNSLSGITNKAKIYINGELASIAASSGDYPSGYVNAAVPHYIGRSASTTYTDGYMAEVNFIDGQALDPTSFGELKSGIWTPKDTAGLTFGTNGFRLQFGDTTTANGFNAVTYTGNGSSQSVSGVGFSSSPDFVWIKERSSTSSHILVNSVRGANKLLSSNTADAEQTDANKVASLDSDGFSLGSSGAVNQSSQTYVAWCWDAGSGSSGSNTDGSITSTVKANQTYGFSTLYWTGTASAGTVGHGLSSAPEMIIAKNASVSDQNWQVYHASVGSTYAGQLQSTTAFLDRTYWNDTDPTSSVFSISGQDAINESGNTIIAYCFHSVTGYSKFGSFVGTGAAGNSITTGFKPAFVLWKSSTANTNWTIADNTRDTSNPITKRLIPNLSNAEDTAISVDFNATGFEFNSGAANDSGQTFIYMAFADTRDAAFWRDTSGQGNDWQPNNLTFSDVVPDSATNNFTVLNNLDNISTTYSEGNLKISQSSYNYNSRGSFGLASGKYYWEVRMDSTHGEFGVCENGKMPQTDPQGAYPAYFIYNNGSTGVIYNNATSVSSSSATMTNWTANDVAMIAYDADNGNLYHGLNGVWQNSADPAAGTGAIITGITSQFGGELVPFFGSGTASARNWIVNFGQDSTFSNLRAAGGNADENGLGDFAHPVPSGFLSLCSSNLPTGAIDTLADETPEDYFNTVLYSATAGVAGSVTGYGFAPDWLWTKARNATQSHQLFDNVRGDGVRLITNSTAAELAAGASYVSLEDDGFDYGSSTFSSNNFVGWGWKANGSGVSNTDGSITSTVSVGATSQQNWFSVVSYTGTGSAGATVGHGLDGTVPDMIIVKSRTEAVGWYVYHSSVASDPETRFLRLDTTAAVATADGAWNNTAPSSSVITLGDGGSTNRSTEDYIAYCFANAEGLCKVGSYVGNGSTDGTFVFTGHRPALLITKHVSSGNWAIWDNRRDPENVVDNLLYPNLSNAQNTGTDRFDFLSNGFKCKNTNDANAWNASGVEYIFLSIAEQPFKFANAR